MNFSDKLNADLMRVDFTASNKDEALHKIAAYASQAPALKGFEENKLYELLAERESAVSTGLGSGLAIPHTRLAGLDDFVIFTLIAPRGIEFDALDKRKVHIFFVVFAPEDRVHEHLKILATISRIMAGSRFRKELLQTQTPEVLQEVVSRAVAESDQAMPSRSAGPQKLMVIILYYEDDLRAVLEYLIDQGIEGATIINAQGMGAYVSTIPLFAGFLSFMREDRNVCNTVLTLVSEGHEKRIIDGIEQITGDLDTKQGAMILSLDVSFSKGTMNMI